LTVGFSCAHYVNHSYAVTAAIQPSSETKEEPTVTNGGDRGYPLDALSSKLANRSENS
jgi:hypothetical protein